MNDSVKDSSLSVVLAGGGTAGHVEPAMAVADALVALDPQVRITALGTARGLETKLVPERGYSLELITPVPLPRKPTGDLARLPRASDLLPEAGLLFFACPKKSNQKKGHPG